MPDYPKPETVKLATNVPVTLDRVQFCDYQPPSDEHPDWPPQLKITGKQGQKDVRIYAPIALENKLQQMGRIERTGGADRWGHPAFKVLSNAGLTFLKEEKGTKKYVTVTGDKMNGQGKALSSAPLPRQTTKGTDPDTTPPTPPWVALEAVYARCVGIAVKCWAAHKIVDIDPGALVAAVATLFIEASKRGLQASDPYTGTAQKPKAFAPTPAEEELEAMLDDQPPLDESEDDSPF